MRSEVAFVVAMDRVRSTALTLERKAALSEELADAIRASDTYRAAEACEQVISLDSGDGAAIVFFGDPLSAIDTAVQVHESVNGRPGAVPLRVGVHAGPVVRRIDFAGKPNVDGQGIDIAFRVMAASDGRYVLVSESYADMLRAFEGWGERLSAPALYRVKCDTVCACRIAPSPVGRQGRPTAHSGQRTDSMRVAIIYRRYAEPDGTLLAKVERWLVEAGHAPFVDRHLSIGVEWAREIEERVRGADAVIALLSDRACDSEMVLYELQTACDERDIRGRPAILPVRIGGDHPLSGEVGSLVARFQYIPWSSDDDDARLRREIENALAGPDRERAEPVGPVEQPGGAVPLDSPYYIKRAVDDQYYKALERGDSIVLLKGARQMGKTSLLARGLEETRRLGRHTVLTDFQSYSYSLFESQERLYKSLMHALISQLGIAIDLSACWNPWLGENANLEGFIEGTVLPAVEGQVVWAMDEVDKLFAQPYASDFFGLVRSWHNRRALEPRGPWRRITIAIAYATEAHLFISDLNQSPFNVGTRLTLADFTAAEVDELNTRYGSPLTDDGEIAAFMELLGGQPYLTRRALDEMAREGWRLADLREAADREDGPFGDHLRRIMVALANDASLARAAGSLLAGGDVLRDTFYRLRAGGVLAGAAPSEATFRCRLYEEYLRRHLGPEGLLEG